MLRFILLIIAYSGIFESGTSVKVTSGFGDYRPRDPSRHIARYHFHHGIDLSTSDIKHKPVYYPDDDKDRKNYKPKVVYTRDGNNQTYDLIIGRFDFIHLALRGKRKKIKVGNKFHVVDTTIPVSLLNSLNIPKNKRIEVRKDWRALWDYCKDNANETDTTCIWTGGLQVGIVYKDHLHLTELLIPNEEGISKNLFINPLWEFTGTLEFNKGTYLRYGNYEDVSDTIQPANTSVAERVNPSYPGYMTMDSVSSTTDKNLDTLVI